MGVDRADLPSPVDLTRSWSWGIAILGHPDADLPEVRRNGLIAIGDGVAILNVRHAQDAEAGADFATATVHVRSVGEPLADSRLRIGEFVVRDAGGGIVLEDADESLLLATPGSTIRVVVSAEKAPVGGLDEVWIDLIPLSD